MLHGPDIVTRLFVEMADPIFVRDLSNDEIATLEEAITTDSHKAARRARILLLSFQEMTSTEIADRVGCTPQTVRNAIHDFNERGLDSLRPDKPGPKDPERIFEEFERAHLIYFLNQDPQDFSKESSEWTLSLLAEVAYEQGITDRVVSHETIRQAILEAGYTWEEAKKAPSPSTAMYGLLKATNTFPESDE